jgi:hypothetical protein
MLSVHAGEAETIHSEDKSINEFNIASEPVKHVLTDLDAEAANLNGAIALKVGYAIFGGSCSATNHQLRNILGDRCVHMLNVV